MDVFLSYARADAGLVGQLQADIERSRRTVWFDRDLEGGQPWWDEILERIRACDLFVFALSEHSARSLACRTELAYAVAVRRPILPVAVREFDPQKAPDPIGSLQLVSYERRSADSAIELLTAVNAAPRPGRSRSPPGASRLACGSDRPVHARCRCAQPHVRRAARRAPGVDQPPDTTQ